MVNAFVRGIKDSERVEILYRQSYAEVVKPYQNYLSKLVKNGGSNKSIIRAITPIWNQQSQIYDELVQKRRRTFGRIISRRKRLGFRIIAQAKILEKLNDPEMIRLSLRD